MSSFCWLWQKDCSLWSLEWTYFCFVAIQGIFNSCCANRQLYIVFFCMDAHEGERKMAPANPPSLSNYEGSTLPRIVVCWLIWLVRDLERCCESWIWVPYDQIPHSSRNEDIVFESRKGWHSILPVRAVFSWPLCGQVPCNIQNTFVHCENLEETVMWGIKVGFHGRECTRFYRAFCTIPTYMRPM